MHVYIKIFLYGKVEKGRRLFIDYQVIHIQNINMFRETLSRSEVDDNVKSYVEKKTK